MKITKTLKVRVRQRPDGLFTAEYKGLFFWHSCYCRYQEDAYLYPALAGERIPVTYSTVEDAIDATIAYTESRRIAAPVVMYKNTAELE